MNNQIRGIQTPDSALLGKGQILTARASLYQSPDHKAMQVSQLLFGEHYTIYAYQTEASDEADAWHLVQSQRDGYIGYLYSPDIVPPRFESNAKIRQLSTALYASPDMKSPILHELPFGAELYVEENALSNPEKKHYYFVPALEAWVYKDHLVFNDQPHTDPVALARQFIGLSYIWGGRSGWGCDCSSLVQLCYELCGCLLPRDTSQQVEYSLAFEQHPITRQNIRAADLLFWPGHVAMASSSSTLIHATAFGMQVLEEPIDPVCERIYAAYSTTCRIYRPLLLRQ